MADNLESILCPACRKEMKKVFLSDQGIYVDVCLDGCGGIFFDNREYKKADENAEDITPLINALRDKQFEEVDSTQIRYCTTCGRQMVKNFASAKHEIQIDECYGCGSTFLDYSELRKIRAQYETEAKRGEDALKQFYTEYASEIEAFDLKYNKQMGSPSLLSRILNKMF